MIKVYTNQVKSRVIIYGDLHGCLDAFISLRSKINPSAVDREIVIGDILDRGQSSNELFQYVRENNIESLMGNHEYKYLRYKRHHDKFLVTGKKIPMELNEAKLNIFETFNEEDLQFLEDLPFYIKMDNLTLVHAGILNSMNLDNADTKELEKLLWLRYVKDAKTPLSLGQTKETSLHWSDVYDGNQGIVVYGHEAFETVKINKFSLGIDTGCVYGNKLSACIVSDTNEPLNNYKIVAVKCTKTGIERRV